jgi:hypothetical protein
MTAISSRQKDSSGKSQHTDGSADRRRALPVPFRELRRHLAAIHRILDRDQAALAGSKVPTAAELSQSLCALARISRAIGLTTYCSLALHVLEQVSSAMRTRYVPIDMRDLLRDWVRLSWSYLLAPANPAHAIELTAHLGDLRWERAVCRVQRDALLESLQLETLHLAVLRSGFCSSLRRQSG